MHITYPLEEALVAKRRVGVLRSVSPLGLYYLVSVFVFILYLYLHLYLYMFEHLLFILLLSQFICTFSDTPLVLW